MTRQEPLYIGCGAGFSGDRVDAAVAVVAELAQRGGPSCLIFETLAERTLALAQLQRQTNPEGGYEPLLEAFLRPVLATCLANKIRIVGNFGAANPTGAARCIQRLAHSLGLAPPRIAVIHGDDVSAPEWRARLDEATAGALQDKTVISANVYIGATAIAQALQDGADIVVAGRVADPSLVLGPAIAHFGWDMEDWDRLASATMAGHLLECGAQVTGGYYADPGIKDVPGLAQLGYPIAILLADGSFQVTKPRNTGGLIDIHTVTEQLLYELHDPCAYLTPDVVADITHVSLEQAADDVVRVSGVKGHPRPEQLKANICFASGWLAEAEISYAGVRAEARARLAAAIVRERMGHDTVLRCDLIGVSSILADDRGHWLASLPAGEAQDVRLRLSLRTEDPALANRLLQEVTALYTCGPAGGGGVRTHMRPTLGTISALLPRTHIQTRYVWLENADA